MKFSYSYNHVGYIAEDNDHDEWGDEGTVEAENLDEAVHKAMEARMDENLTTEWVSGNCDIHKDKDGTSATLIWSFSDADGNGETTIKVTEVDKRKEIAEGVIEGVLVTAMLMARNTPESLGEYEHEVSLRNNDGWRVVVGDKEYAFSVSFPA